MLHFLQMALHLSLSLLQTESLSSFISVTTSYDNCWKITHSRRALITISNLSYQGGTGFWLWLPDPPSLPRFRARRPSHAQYADGEKYQKCACSPPRTTAGGALQAVGSRRVDGACGGEVKLGGRRIFDVKTRNADDIIVRRVQTPSLGSQHLAQPRDIDAHEHLRAGHPCGTIIVRSKTGWPQFRRGKLVHLFRCHRYCCLNIIRELFR